MRYVTVANTRIKVVEYEGKRVMTSTQVIEMFGDKNFVMNNRKTVKNRSNDYIKLDKESAKYFTKANGLPLAHGGRGIVLWGEGAVRVFSDIACKSSLMKELEEKYFGSENPQPEEVAVVPLIGNEVEEEPLNINSVDDIGVEDDRVDGRRLHAFLQVETRYNDWFERMCEYGFTEGADFYSKMSKTIGQTGRPSINHSMTIDMAKEISMLQRNERGKQARLYFIECEKRSKQKPMTMMEMVAAQATAMVEQERKTKQLQTQVAQQAKEIQGIRETITLRPDDDWRGKTTKLINRIVDAMGGGANTHMEVRRQIYNALNERFGVCVDTRLRNKRDRMREVGCSKTQVDKTNILDVIAEDKKLIEGYIAIVKDMAIKYGVAYED